MAKKLDYQIVKNIIECTNEFKLISTDYKSVKNKLEILHIPCNNKFNRTLDKFKNNKKCPHCFPPKNKKKTTALYKKEVQEKYGDEFEILGEYINSRTSIKTKHKCGYIWEIRPDNLLMGYGCPSCGGSLPLTNITFKKRVKEIYKDEYTVLGEYTNKTNKILIRHNKCGHEYNVIAGNFIYNKTECPLCIKKQKASKGERRISKWLDKNNIRYKTEYTFDDCKYIQKLRFDFAIFIENEMILLEYDGRQHFKSSENIFKKTNLETIQKRDEIKNKYCEKNNIKLIRINYKDYNNIETILSNTFNDYPKIDNVY